MNSLLPDFDKPEVLKVVSLSTLMQNADAYKISFEERSINISAVLSTGRNLSQWRDALAKDYSDKYSNIDGKASCLNSHEIWLIDTVTQNAFLISKEGE